ncbi:MAG: DUF6263 family protein [Melioribacteraceae bacterium]|nr:DUF6263 family protein [Melioribacteraceae bacterium]
MKNFIFVLILFLVLASCAEDKDVDKEKAEEQVKLETEKVKGPELDLKYKFRSGNRFSYKLNTQSDNTEEITADTVLANEITQNATYKMDFRVRNVDDFNTADIEVKITSIIAETIFNGESVTYDSKFIYSTRERIQFVDYEAVKNIPFRISVNDIGQVVKVDGIERIMKNILEIQQIPDTLSSETKERMKLNISNGTLMPLTQQIFKVLPQSSVGVDSLWQLKYNTPLAVFNVENTGIYKLTGFEFGDDTLANISSTLLVNVTGDNMVKENGMTYSFSEPKLNAEGTVKYNVSKGLVEFSESVTTVEMMMYVEGNDSNNQPIRSTKKDYSQNRNTVELQ